MPTDSDPDRHLIRWFRGFRPSAEPRFDADAAWQRFARLHSTKGHRRQRQRRRFATVATLVAAAGIVAVAVLWNANRPHAGPQRLEFADGSTVVVRGGSLRTSTGQREVLLEGEASFEVRHDSLHPFRVRTSRGVIEDVGTRFDVRSYPGDSAFAVIVREGAVSLNEPGKPQVVLVAGDLMSEFEHVSLAAVAKTLEQAFAGRIMISDSALARRPITARLRGRSMEDALDAIVGAVGASYERDGDAYRLRSGEAK
jgi:ferric-dicitrate binding protein FerR (iron transport regulator)